MPPKITDLIDDLKRGAGFKDRGGKGSHRIFVHENVTTPLTLSGKLGDDAKSYQVRAAEQIIKESKR